MSDDENSFLNRWGGEIYFDNFDIYINERIGSDNGLRAEFGFNLTGVEGETVLLTGKVKVEVLESNQQKGGSYVLKPNEKLTYSKTDGISLTTIDADAYSSWRQGKRMSFKNETLEMILERLEKWYGQKIE